MAETGDGDAGAARPVDRRTFVKGAMAGAAIGAAGAGGLAALGWATGSWNAEGHGEVQYFGAKVQVGSPTRLGVPLLPILVDGAGFVHGRRDDLRPHLYCRRGSTWSGASADYQGDDILRYAVPEGKVLQAGGEAEARERWWFYDRLGERVHVDHFADVPKGEGAMVSWRSSGDTGYEGFFGVLLKIPRGEIVAEGAAGDALRAAMDPQHDLVAFDAACTHFCCVAGWHEDPTAERFDAWDTIFCTCHMARFDPRMIEPYAFTLRGEDDLPRAP